MLSTYIAFSNIRQVNSTGRKETIQGIVSQVFPLSIAIAILHDRLYKISPKHVYHMNE